MLVQHKQLAIVGAGPGGLTAARLLQRQGATVKVYERDATPQARVQGSPLDMHEESGWAALQKAELVAEFRQHIRHGADRKIVTDKYAHVLFSDHAPAAASEADSEPARPEIDRGALRQLLLNSLLPGTVEWDRHFVTMERNGEGWQLYFKDGTSVYADLVVGADSANSKIRPYLTPIKACYAGITMLEVNVPAAATTTPALYEMLAGGKVMAFGDSKCLLGGQKGSGELGFYASFKTGPDWATTSGVDFADNAQVLAWFHQTYAGWSHRWDELFSRAAPPAIPRPLYYMPLDQTWEAQANLTLLGDAAHVMPPFAGEGANTSMRDALELSECLTSAAYPTVRAAIAAYEVAMRARAAQATQASLANGERMHSPEALATMLALFTRQQVSRHHAPHYRASCHFFRPLEYILMANIL